MDNYYRPCDFSKIVCYPHEVPEKAIDKLPSFQGDNVTSAKATSEISVYVLQDGAQS